MYTLRLQRKRSLLTPRLRRKRAKKPTMCGSELHSFITFLCGSLGPIEHATRHVERVEQSGLGPAIVLRLAAFLTRSLPPRSDPLCDVLRVLGAAGVLEVPQPFGFAQPMSLVQMWTLDGDTPALRRFA